ncbi:FecCD family ABC transporter permease [Proteiniclasticum sp. C24MP]|uniref:FecCD family ABC transporter permease n=1 Tax=Proteiniclasticum sp. C24MP TaxID=3374101 RepID=UPI00375408D6
MSFVERKGFYRSLFFLLLLGLLMLMIFVSTLGAAEISFLDALAVLLKKVPVAGDLIQEDGLKTHEIIMLNIRLPRVILSAIIGMGLSVVGAAFQGMFKNPMADPYVIGVSSGAALGASIAITLGSGFLPGLFLSVQFMAFLGAVMTVVCVYEIAKVGTRIPAVTLLLAGVAVSAMASAMISVLMIFNRDQADTIIFWTMGSVAAARWEQILYLLPVVSIGTLVILFYAKDLNLMMAGDDAAHNLGVEIEKTKKMLLVVSSLMIAFIVSSSGIIGFVGLIVPHAVRLLLGPDHRVLIPFSALGGAVFMILSDTIARTLLAPMEIPVGAITALFGAPYFIFLLRRTKIRGISL